MFENCHLRLFNRRNIRQRGRVWPEINLWSSLCILKRVGLNIWLNLLLFWQFFSKFYIMKRKLLQSLNKSKNYTENERKKMFLSKDTT